MISKVTSFSCAIVNILVSPIPVGGRRSANLSAMVITHAIVRASTVDVEQAGRQREKKKGQQSMRDVLFQDCVVTFESQ